jgi:hypothetical protein
VVPKVIELAAVLMSPRSGSVVDGRCCRPGADRTPGPELPLKLHQAPDPDAVRPDGGLDLYGRLVDGGQVDAEQLRAPLQWRLLSRPTTRTASSSLSFSLPGSRLGLLEDG